MASNNSPRQLNINCTVSAVYLPEQGTIFGAHSRGKQQEDPTNTLSATFFEQIERNKYSPNLGTISTGAGGLIPKVNLLIGAPAATFSEGFIDSGDVHPILNLLKGPGPSQASKFNPQITYQIPPGSTVNPLRSSPSLPLSGTGSSTEYPSGSTPFIPMAKIGPYENLTARTTYNIWTQTNVDQRKLTYVINNGVINYNAVGAVQMVTNVNTNGAKITVYAKNKTCVVRRIFPIADDIAYDNTDEGKCKLYYPKLENNIISAPEEIKAKGGPNCGFWLHIETTEPGSYYRTDSSDSSQILIYWGYKNEKPAERRITEFVIVFDKGKSPSLRYKKPGAQYNNTIQSILNTWGKVDLKGPIFGSSNGIIDIFVHYAGSNMYIGFESEVSKWNVFEPIKVDQLTEESSDDAYYEPYISEKSIIEIFFKNLASSFTYSPICFNNFNYDYLSINNADARNRIAVNFNVSQSEFLTGSCSPVKIKEAFITKRKPIYTAPRDANSPTFYGDWRRRTESDDEYFAAPELSYQENSVVTDDAVPDNVRTLVTGQINYDTTIEGPVFFYVRNLPEAPQRNLITRPIWGSYSDISSYLTSAQVTENYGRENRNNSYKTATANLIFSNLSNDLIGLQILNAMQENTLVYTLKAGYDSNLNTFFQGIAREVTVTRTPDGFTVNVLCQDLGDALLSDIRFNTTSSFPMANQSFKFILESSFYFAGLIGVYEPRQPKPEGTFDALYSKFFNGRIGAPGLNFQSSLARDVLTVNKNNKIKEVVKTILNLMLYTPNDASAKEKSLPVLYWSPEKHRFVLTLRNDEPQDSLYFAGDNSDPEGIIKLANSNPDREHGIVESQGWEESTRISNLHSKVIFAVTLFNNSIFYKESSAKSINNALSSTSLDKLNNFVVNPNNNTDLTSLQSQPVLGYVGYHKEYLAIDENSKLYQDEAFAREQFYFREKFARETYTAIKLNVYVTKPLTTSGTFVVKSFEGGYENETGNYIYASVTYNFDIDNNIIKARIEGERFPDIIGE